MNAVHFLLPAHIHLATSVGRIYIFIKYLLAIAIKKTFVAPIQIKLIHKNGLLGAFTKRF